MAIKYLKINSFKEEDTNALFEALCEKACDTNINEAKMLCNDNLDEKSVVGYKASLSDVIALIGLYDIEFEFKTSYVSRDSSPEQKKNNETPKQEQPSDKFSKMVAQKNDITNPDLQNEKSKKEGAPQFIETPGTVIDPTKIPGFPQ